ncbi:MAG: acetyltransferase [Lachnospiraceae bacterium]|nr:acetyltransferase [Lachnospiraceae bacterium]
MEDIILIGLGGHAKSIVDTIETSGSYNIVGFIDVDTEKSYRDYNVIGNDDDIKEIYDSGIKNAFVSIGYMGNSNLRNQLYYKLKEIGFVLPSIIDKTAIIAKDVDIGEGTFIGKNAIVNADSKIGKMCIINTGVILEHDCEVGDFTHIAVGTSICGGCKIEENVFIGAKTIIIQGIIISSDSRIGAGATILKNINDNSLVVGVWK